MSEANEFFIEQELIDQIVAHARRGAPYEVCGMVGGKGRSAMKVYPARNIEASEVTYTVDPREAFQIVKQMRNDKLDLIAGYHSHPETEAYPSAIDRRKAGDTDLVYLILSLRQPNQPELRAFKIHPDTVRELKVVTSKLPD